MVAPIGRGERAGESDSFRVGGQLDPGLGGTEGTTEWVLAQQVESPVPALPQELAAALAVEPPGQAVTGVDVGQRGGGMGASSDDPMVPEVGLQDLG